MPEQNKNTVNIDPNMYALNGVKVGFNEEEFYFLLVSGNQARQLQTTPKHAKRIKLLLEREIQKYEDKFGEIQTKLPEDKKNTEKENKIGF